MKLVLQEFLSLDGVCQGPGSPDEDTRDGFTGGGWFVPHLDEAFDRVASTWLDSADAFLFGRRTYETFADFARDLSEATDRPDVRVMNGAPKFVASQTLTEAAWEPTTILSGDIPGQVAELKRRPGRELQIHGSGRLGRSMLAAGLIDELRLAIAPVVVGSGRRLFPDGATPVGLRLLHSETTPSGVAVHVYEPTGRPEHGTYGADA
ncbi:dihydrofolate reductase family protein [Streptomyces sp. NPDC101733]|uniref:dihydrofolate reductase family protein n=1 Tax=unclassified Streptomyces TaxID=2593676 RepID=UPI00381F367A